MLEQPLKIILNIKTIFSTLLGVLPKRWMFCSILYWSKISDKHIFNWVKKTSFQIWCMTIILLLHLVFKLLKNYVRFLFGRNLFPKKMNARHFMLNFNVAIQCFNVAISCHALIFRKCAANYWFDFIVKWNKNLSTALLLIWLSFNSFTEKLKRTIL